MNNQILSSGDVIADLFIVQRTIQSGGMGIVYLCQDRRNRIVALKTLKPEFLFNTAIRDRFLQEALTWIRLGSHPNIVVAEWVQQFGDRPYILMEAVTDSNLNGRDLRILLRQQRKLSEAQVANFCWQIAQGMNYAANQLPELVHCDLKPENVLLTSDLQCKVSDFGLARAAYVQGGGGTPLYMSPEQWLNRSLDARSDIYALGCIAYELLTGRPPFTHQSLKALRQAHCEDMPPRLSGTHKELAQFVATCLQKAPGNRFPNWTSVLEALQTFIPESSRKSPSQESPFDPQAVLFRVSALAQADRIEEAISLCRTITERHPDFLIGWTTLIHLLSYSGQHNESLTILEPLIRKNSGSADLWIAQSSALLARATELPEDRQESALWKAVESVDRALQLNPESAHALASKASILGGLTFVVDDSSRTQMAGGVLHCIEAAEVIDATILDKRVELIPLKARMIGLFYDASQAESALDALLNRYPGLPELWAQKVMLMIDKNRLDEAQSYLNQAFQLDPSDRQLAIAQDRLNFRKQEIRRQQSPPQSLADLLKPSPPEESTANLWEIVNFDKRDPESWLLKAEDHNERQEYNQALQACATAIQLDAYLPAAWLMKGFIEGNMGDFASAEKSFEYAVKLAPKNENAWFFFGLVAAESGKRRQAIERLEKAHLLGHPDAAEAINDML